MSKRLLTIQDLSIVGQCSLGVALPIIAAFGVEACGLPSSVLSTHTAKGFEGFVYHDLTAEMDNIKEHWKKIGIKFDGITTGYCANPNQLALMKSIIKECKADKCKIIIDPVMGDSGKPYSQINETMIKEMRKFIKGADLILPNMTEAYLLLDREYKPCPLADEIEEMLQELHKLSGGDVILTGVNFMPKQIGVAYLSKGETNYCFSDLYEGAYHGAGDILGAIIGATVVQEIPLKKVLPEALEYISKCISETDLNEHWYGINFELHLAEFASSMLKLKK